MHKNGRRDVSTALIAAGTASLLALPAMAGDGPAMDELLDEVARLRDRVGELEARSTADDRLTEARAAELRELMGDVLADADSRASLLQSGATAGHDGGFFLQSSDGNFRLNLKGMIQFRYVMSLQDNTADASGDDTRGGFELSRTRYSFSGHVIDPSFKYFIWGGWNASGGALLLDAWIQKDYENGWSIRAGQFKLPTWQEWTFSEARQQFVERSLLDARYGQLYSQGVMGIYKADNLRFYGAFSDGARTLNTPAISTGPDSSSSIYQQATDVALTGRAEYLIEGDWANYSDYTSPRDSERTFVVGGSLHYQIGESGTDDLETEILQFTADGSFKFGGWNLYGAFIWSSIDDDAMTDRDEMGFLLQGGYYLTDEFELIAKYEYGDLDGGGAVQDDLNVVTVGFNRYWNSHGMKWTTDIGYALDEIDAGWNGSSRGFRADSAGEDGQIVIRSQLQLLF